MSRSSTSVGSSKYSHPRVSIETFDDGQGANKETVEACKFVNEALNLRAKYLFVPAQPVHHDSGESLDVWHERDLVKPAPDSPFAQYRIGAKNGIIRVYADQQALDEDKPLVDVHSITDYERDYNRIVDITNSGPMKTFSWKRLKQLDFSFHFHRLLNEAQEIESTQMDDPKDFSNVVKVDTHIHLAAAMTAKHLLTFIKRKLTENPNTVVSRTPDGKEVTLIQTIQHLGLEVADFTVDALDVRADNTFQRFDNFNDKYSPFGFSELRTIFLKSENQLEGKFFAELTQETADRLEESKYCMAEWRVSIYGRKAEEWDSLAKWICDNKLYSDHNRWMIQVPRIYTLFKKTNQIKNFGELIQNVFRPLFEVTLDPTSHPHLHKFLRQVSGFDSVDDESRPERQLCLRSLPQSPEAWDIDENPPYAYWLYYMWANLVTLNRLREARGLNTFDLRPHCGESGDADHLAAAFLLARGINHGIKLHSRPPLEYLYYVAQIGIAVSPLSNNALFLEYKKNPFNRFFRRGLNVSLSTDDPLQFHYTQSPLIEEYAIAGQQWNLNSIDLSEIARNSVLQSGYEHRFKAKWLGPRYYLPFTQGNDINYSNIPNMRVLFREETFHNELQFVKACSGSRTKQRPTREDSFRLRTQTQYSKLHIIYPPGHEYAGGEEMVWAAKMLAQALALRAKYAYVKPSLKERVMAEPLPEPSAETLTLAEGVYHVAASETALCANDLDQLASVECADCQASHCRDCDAILHRNPQRRTHKRYAIKGGDRQGQLLYTVPSYAEFVRDYRHIKHVVSDLAVCQLADQRLRLLEARFDLHSLVNTEYEKDAMRFAQQDFYHVVKVDTHIHAASAVVAPKLLAFIKNKYATSPNDIVVKKGEVTLEALFKSTGVPIENFTLDSLDTHSNHTTYGRFDKFNSKYNPFGSSDLRTLFLKKSNDVDGRYFGELLRQELDQLEKGRHEMAEWRISVYGTSPKEWSHLAQWVMNNRLVSPHLKWVIQVPRLYHILKEKNDVHSFQDMLDNIFLPLFEVTKNPSLDPVLHRFITEQVSGFDSVDNEDVAERKDLKTCPADPRRWDTKENPPYAYYLYFMWANVWSLNKYRETRSLNTFDFRPHSGAAGPIDHLAAAFLLSNGITHGSNLKHCLPLQYLYYLAQVGIAISPLGEHALYADYSEGIFVSFFKRGLNVSLSTDCPLQLHQTPEPLVEEYSIAAQLYRLSVTDLSEVARNSVLQSGFTHSDKVQWIGDNYWKAGIEGNTPSKTNLPHLRIAFRSELLQGEKDFIAQVSQKEITNTTELALSSSTEEEEEEAKGTIKPTSDLLRRETTSSGGKMNLLRNSARRTPIRLIPLSGPMDHSC